MDVAVIFREHTIIAASCGAITRRLLRRRDDDRIARRRIVIAITNCEKIAIVRYWLPSLSSVLAIRPRNLDGRAISGG